MSEPTAPDTETTDPAEPTTPDEDAPDQGDDDALTQESDDDEPAPQTPKQAAETEGSNELLEALNKEKDLHRKRLEKILGIPLTGAECAVCEGHGFVTGEQEAAGDLVHPENYQTCEACAGYGVWITGSKVPEYATGVCTHCQGKGYEITAAQITPQTPLAQQNGEQPVTQPVSNPVLGYQHPDGHFVPIGAAA